MEYWVYVIESETTGTFYKGMTSDLDARLKQHNWKKVKSTQHGVPWKFIYTELFETKEAALAQEKYFKTAAGRRYLKKKIF